MARHTRFSHTNLVADDWQALASFYQRVFGCAVVLPERHLSGAALEAGTGIQGARIDGVHLRVPGHGASGPTLEIFSYFPTTERVPASVNRPGYGHVAFEVDSVDDKRREVLREGGRAIGEVVTLTVADGRSVTWCYVTDPEDNVVELQSWAPAQGVAATPATVQHGVDEGFVREAIALAAEARRRGDHPFGALLVVDGQVVLRAMNAVATERDPTAHAEANLIAAAVAQLDPADLSRAVLYTSCEPCAMCAGTIYWAGIRTVVFALSSDDLATMAGPDFLVPCRDLFARAADIVKVRGPLLLDEAREVHEGFWHSSGLA